MVNECYLFGGLIMDCYYAIDAFPERGQDGFITAEKMMAGCKYGRDDRKSRR